jgi:3-hydroxyisobutyrate dehydrogenase-like beta-hydroxyacid dehydrogenase
MRRIGFVGLGVMGGPMAANLLKAGFAVTAFDLRRDAVDRLVTQGAAAAGGLGQVRMFLDFALREPSQLDALVETGLKDMELAASFCTQAGVKAPLLQHAIAALKELGVEGLRSDLAAVMRAARA